MNLNTKPTGFGARRKPFRTSATVFIALMAAAIAVAAQPTNVSGGLNYDKFQIIAERNIFDQSREPHERAAQPARVPDSFSLVGTLLYAGGDIAFFNGTSDEYRKALKVGGDIAGFKVTAITPDSVTLSDGTNQVVLKIPTQMRRDDDGHWSVSTEPVAYSSIANSSGSISERMSSTRSRYYISTQPNSQTMTGLTPDTAASSSRPSSALERLMQRRAQEEQQLRQ